MQRNLNQRNQPFIEGKVNSWTFKKTEWKKRIIQRSWGFKPISKGERYTDGATSCRKVKYNWEFKNNDVINKSWTWKNWK